MWAWAAALCFAIAFILYWLSAGKVPFDTTGFALLGLVALALHAALGWNNTPWRHG